MNKNEFLAELDTALAGLPKDDREERLAFYSEMIDDRVEEGADEEQAISEIGSVKDIVTQTLSEISFAKIVKERIKPKRKLKTWEKVLFWAGSPLWLVIAVTFFAVIVSLYATIWSILISIFAVFVSLIASAFGGIIAGVVIAVGGEVFTGIALIGAATVCAGLAIFLYIGCKKAFGGTVLLTKKLALSIKRCFVKREEV